MTEPNISLYPRPYDQPPPWHVDGPDFGDCVCGKCPTTVAACGHCPGWTPAYCPSLGCQACSAGGPPDAA